MAAVDRNRPKRAASSDSTYTVMEFNREFPDDATCLDYLWRKHYSDDGDRAYCPKCEVERKFHRVASRPSYSCDNCGHHIHPTADTIFHKSSTSLQLWFYAIFLMSQTRCGISAKQLERELGVTYKTAWRMFHLIRNELMNQDDDNDPLVGEVEMDETSVGGKPRSGEIRAKAREGYGPFQAGQIAAREKRTTVFGMVERGGKVAAHIVPQRFQAEAMRHVSERVLPESIIYTDEAPAYKPLGAKGYQHKRVHHSAKVYVDGDTHTQTIEGFWSLVKRGISGTYHAVSAKHLQSYLDEFVWRYNHRNDERPMFFTLLDRIAYAP